MKKSLLLGILGAAAMTLSSHGQGILFLQNYTVGGHYVTYGNTAGALGAAGTDMTSGTVGFYWATGTVSVPTDSTGSAAISGLLSLATGTGSTATIGNGIVFGTAGAYQASGAWAAPAGNAGGATVTLETVVYNGSDYNSSSYRGHSEAFQVVLGAPTGSPTPTGPTDLPLSIQAVPEPSILAMSGIGAAALALIRRKK